MRRVADAVLNRPGNKNETTMKTATKHTPGRWLRGQSFDGSQHIFSHPESALTPIASVWKGLGDEEAEANANLVEHATALYDALDRIAFGEFAGNVIPQVQIEALRRIAREAVQAVHRDKREDSTCYYAPPHPDSVRQWCDCEPEGSHVLLQADGVCTRCGGRRI